MYSSDTSFSALSIIESSTFFLFCRVSSISASSNLDDWWMQWISQKRGIALTPYAMDRVRSASPTIISIECTDILTLTPLSWFTSWWARVIWVILAIVLTIKDGSMTFLVSAILDSCTIMSISSSTLFG